MVRLLAGILLALLVLTGCSGISIKGLDKRPANPSALAGYLVYEPIVMVAVAQAQHGGCAVTQFTVPDYRRPYLLGARTGLGKSGVNVTITDGWRLGGFTDNSDNSSLFPVSDMFKALVGADEREGEGAGATPRACDFTGLFVVGEGAAGLPVFTRVSSPEQGAP